MLKMSEEEKAELKEKIERLERFLPELRPLISELDSDGGEIASLCGELHKDYEKVKGETDKYEEELVKRLGVGGHMAAVNYLRHLISDTRSVLIEDSGKIKSILLCARRIDKSLTSIKKALDCEERE